MQTHPTEIHPMPRHPTSAVLAAAFVVLAGCVTTGTTPGPVVGPGSTATAETAADPYRGVRLDVVVPVFDPGLP